MKTSAITTLLMTLCLSIAHAQDLKSHGETGETFTSELVSYTFVE